MRADSNQPDLIAPVWTGNVSLVEEAYQKSAAGAILLETRLDADDGLHYEFIETIQTEARNNLVDIDGVKGPNELWRVWCIHSNVEWHPLFPFPDIDGTKAVEDEEYGYLVMFADKKTW